MHIHVYIHTCMYLTYVDYDLNRVHHDKTAVLRRDVPRPNRHCENGALIRNLKPLAIFCGCTARFVSGLVGNSEDRFSYDAARSTLTLIGRMLLSRKQMVLPRKQFKNKGTDKRLRMLRLLTVRFIWV